MPDLASSNRPKAIIYVDGLNLQRQLETTKALQWVNLMQLCELMLPNYEITQIRYFTTRLRATPSHQDAGIEQEIYWRALRTLEPQLTFHFGTMRRSVRFYPTYPLSEAADGSWQRVRVLHTEEKGSDVALGSFMVADAAKAPRNLQVLVSNDSDFAPTLHILKEEFNAQYAVLSPSQRINNALIETNPVFIRSIRAKTVARSQFPRILEDSNGHFQAPENWD